MGSDSIGAGPEQWAAPLVLLDADMRVREANAGAAEMFGHSSEALRRTGMTELVADCSELIERVHGSARGTVRVEGRRASGVRFPLELRLGERSPAGLIPCELRDLNVLGLEEETARYFDSAFDLAPTGMALLNSDGLYIRVNGALCRLLGRHPEELLGRREQELTHPEDRRADAEAIQRILRGEASTWQTEKRFLHADGSLVWTIASLTFLRDEAGRPLCWVGQYHDVTVRVHAEAARRRERDLSTAILAGMNEGLMLLREDRIALVNDALCRLTGFSREELNGAPAPFPFWPSADEPGRDAPHQRLLAQGSEGELRLCRKDGSHFYAAISGSRATDRNGSDLGFVVTIRDVTKHRRQREKLGHLAVHDPLTGLLNRRLFDEQLRANVTMAVTEGKPLSLAILDIDDFKRINDTHGRRVGDRVLVEIGRRLQNLRRNNEPIARVGGEEFAWLLVETSGVAAFAAAERARATIQNQPFEGVGDLTVSIGVCELAEEMDPDELYRLADTALSWAKAQGRNITFRYTPATASELGADSQQLDAERQFQARTMQALARAVDEREASTAGHSARVAMLAQRIALRAGWTADKAALLHDAALVHDVGKVAIPDAILLKPGPLTQLEYLQVKTHAAIGAQMLSHVLNRRQAGWVRHHHERWDGGGYPDGLHAEQIPDGAAILALANAWDAMGHTRHYAHPRTRQEALDEVMMQSGLQFAPDRVNDLLAVLGALHA